MLSVNVKAAFEIAPLSLRVRSACPVDLWGQKELGPVKPTIQSIAILSNLLHSSGFYAVKYIIPNNLG